MVEKIALATLIRGMPVQYIKRRVVGQRRRRRRALAIAIHASRGRGALAKQLLPRPRIGRGACVRIGTARAVGIESGQLGRTMVTVGVIGSEVHVVRHDGNLRDADYALPGLAVGGSPVGGWCARIGKRTLAALALQRRRIRSHEVRAAAGSWVRVVACRRFGDCRSALASDRGSVRSQVLSKKEYSKSQSSGRKARR